MDGMIGDASENIGKIGLRIDAAHLCRLDDGVDTSGALSAGIGATEEIVFATENWRSHAALGGIVAHLQPAIRQVTQQRAPSGEGIADGSGECAFAANPFQGSLEELLQLVHSRTGILDTRGQASIRRLAANAGLDDEQGGDLLHSFQRDRRLVAETPETGEIKDSFFEQRLALVDVATAKLDQISPADTYIYEYDWSPDGLRFAVTAALGNGDNNWYIAELFTLDAATGLMKSIYKPPLQIANPAWSPDGQRIAFIGGLMSDEPSVGGDIFTISATGGEATNLTPEMKASASWLAWTPDAKIIFGEYLEGDSGLATINPSDGTRAELFRDAGQITAGAWGINLSLSRDAKNSAVIRSSFGAPPEVWAGPTSNWTQVTQRNKSIKPAWGEAKSIHWKNGGFEIQGWLLYPRDFDPNKKYPLVVRVHGGPGAAVLSEWPSSSDYYSPLAGAGYFVLQPNPRGSFGQGEAFTRANVKDFGYGDFKDIMAGVDEAIKVAPIDTNRLGICGWSYGGYMTMWAVTQTNRFKAAMAGAGLSNLQSYYGENLIDQWMIPFFGKSVYDDPEVYAKSSPINFIKKVKTPTLILVGDSDGEVPAPQSYEFWHALKTLGVETQFVVYEHEGHMFANPKHRRDVVERTLAWFDSHLK